ASHGPVGHHPHLGVGRAPYLAAVIDGGDPNQIVLLAIINNGEGIAGPLVLNVDGQRRVELGKSHGVSCGHDKRPVSHGVAAAPPTTARRVYPAFHRDGAWWSRGDSNP